MDGADNTKNGASTYSRTSSRHAFVITVRAHLSLSSCIYHDGSRAAQSYIIRGVFNNHTHVPRTITGTGRSALASAYKSPSSYLEA